MLAGRLCASRTLYTIVAMDAWTFVWLMVFLKIPVVALFLIVRWAVKEEPQSAGGGEGGIGPVPRPRHPHHPRSRPPRLPRRGPHAGPLPPAPRRVRTVLAHKRFVCH
jgi:hypothetical protein